MNSGQNQKYEAEGKIGEMLRKGRTRSTEVRRDTEKTWEGMQTASEVKDLSLVDGWQGNWDFISPAARK